MPFYTAQEQEYLTSLGKNVTCDDTGTVFLHFANHDVLGLSPATLCSLLDVNITQAKEILKKSIEIAVISEIENTAQMSNIIMNVAEMIENQDAQYDANTPDYQRKSLLSLRDIAETLGITFDFAQKLFHEYKQPISDESDLSQFMEFVTHYLNQNHAGKIPDTVKHIHVQKSKLKPSKDFTPEHINTILAQEAPKELRSDKEIFSEQAMQKARLIIGNLLDMQGDEAILILQSASNLQEFLRLNTLGEAEDIIEGIYNNNFDMLTNAIEARISGLYNNISDTEIHDVLGDNSTEASVADTEQSDISADDVIDGIVLHDDLSDDTESETAETLAETPTAEPLPDLPETLAGKLSLCFSLRGRVTGKSLAEIFNFHGLTISNDMASFIIEEGEYGGVTDSDKSKITDIAQLNRMIEDIQNAPSLKDFTKKYMKLINDQVQNMFYGGKTG